MPPVTRRQIEPAIVNFALTAGINHAFLQPPGKQCVTILHARESHSAAFTRAVSSRFQPREPRVTVDARDKPRVTGQPYSFFLFSFFLFLSARGIATGAGRRDSPRNAFR